MLAEKVGKKWGKWETNTRQLKISRSENRIEVQHGTTQTEMKINLGTRETRPSKAATSGKQVEEK